MVQAITPEEILALRRRKTQAQQQPTEDRNPLPGFVRDIGGAIGDWVGETAMPALGQAWQAIGDSPAGPVFGEFWDSAQRLADTPTGQLVGKGLSAADIAIRGAGTVGMTALSQGLVPGGAPTALGVPSIFGDWGPQGDPVEALKAFAAQARQGKVDEGITAAHDVLDAGPGFWGAGEIIPAALVPTGAPYLAGTKLASSAPRLAHTISRVAPAAQQAQVARGAETALRGTAAAMRAPWQAEEWVGSQLLRPVRAGMQGIRGTTPTPTAAAAPEPTPVVAPVVRETVEAAVPEPTPGAALVDPPRIPGTRNSEEWAKLYKDEYGIEIIDPDGWRGDTPAFFNRAWKQKITQKTFEQRLAKSTQQRRRVPTVEPEPTPVVAPRQMTKSEFNAARLTKKQMLDRGAGGSLDRAIETEVPISRIEGLEPTPSAAAIGGDKLPRELAGAKPRYNMGQSVYIPQFESDVDKALFIVSQANKSARDESYMVWLRGLLPDRRDFELRMAGKSVREHIKATLRGQPEGDVVIPTSSTVRELDVRVPTGTSPAASYIPGRPITQPVELKYDNGQLILYAGNHRVQQAIANGDRTIPAFVEGRYEDLLDILPTSAVTPVQGAQVRAVASDVDAALRDAGAEVAEGVGGRGSSTENPSTVYGPEIPVRISADVRDGFAVDPELGWWNRRLNNVNDAIELIIGKRVQPTREVGVEGAVESAVRAKQAVERQMVGHSSALGAYIRQGKRVFKLDKADRINDASLRDVPGAIDYIEGEAFPIGRPTVQDIAARMPIYTPYLTEDQLRFMNKLREIFEEGTVWVKGGVSRDMPGWNAILREGIKGWSHERVRPDVMPGGFYLTRGPSRARGAANRDGWNDLLRSLAAGRSEPALNKKIIAQNAARAKSMGNAMDKGVVYDSLEDALVGHINDVARKLADLNIGDVVGRTNRRLARTGPKRTATQVSKEILQDRPGGVPGIGRDTFVDDALADALRRQLDRQGILRIGDFRGLQHINQIYRGFKATADFSAIGIHGAFAAFRDPAMWSRAAKISFDAFFRRDNVGVADEMLRAADDSAQAQGLFTSDFWSTAGLQIGGTGTEYRIPFVSRAAQEGPRGIRQTAQAFERFNLSFGTFGDALRLDWANKLVREELAKGRTIDEIWRSGDARNIASIANRLTGWTEGRFGGDLGDLLLFAPKYLQSRLESYGQAAVGVGRLAGAPFGVRQTLQPREAARTIAQMLFLGAFLTEAINYTTGHETDRRPWVDGSPNPNFYVIRYGGQDFSLFGPSIGLLQAVGNVVTRHPERAMRSLGSGVSRIVWDNLLSGYTFTQEQAPLTKDEEGRMTLADSDAFVRYMFELVTPIAPGQAGAQLLDVGRQIPGALRQIAGEEPAAGDVGPSPLERVVGGVVATAAETVGGRVSPMARSDWQNEIARGQFGKTYDELDESIKPLVDAMVVEQYGETTYKGPKGHLYQQVDDVKIRFLEGLQNVADKRLSVPPGSEQFSPEIARKGTEGMLGYNELRENRISELYGTWNSKKQRLAGGLHDRLYDMDEAREEPEADTREHRVWQYYQVFKDSTNPDTGEIDWDEYDKNISRFWAELESDAEVEEVLANIRVIEGEYPAEIATMIDAGRYAGSTTLNISGAETSYYDLENHPLAVARIATDAGVTEKKVRDHLALPYIERDSKENYTTLGGKIGKALDKARSKDGILWRLRQTFVSNAPTEWILAMFDAGYNYQGGDEINKRLRQQMQQGAPKPTVEYDALYRANLKRNR